jgi:protein involved in polysaccharide export with SLBB domain
MISLLKQRKIRLTYVALEIVNCNLQHLLLYGFSSAILVSLMRFLSFIVVLASALSINASLASAQEIHKGDLPDPRTSLDQAPITIGDAAKVEQGGRGATRISNHAPGDLASALAAERTITADVRSKPEEMGEFQRFIHDNTGQYLPMFGAEFFNNKQTSITPVNSAPVPADYPLGPGDEVLVRGWGSIDIDYRAIVDRNGLISLPTIGVVTLGGVRAGEAESVLQAAVDRLYKGVKLSVTFGKLRGMTVYVVGQAARPGTYIVPSTSTLVTALFASGGPNGNGSLRHIQVKRAGKVVGTIDLYSFLAKGDKAADIRLLDGDTIFIPAAVGHVALVGKVNRPAIYELLTASDSVDSVLEVAGGVPVVADPRRVFLERIEPGKPQPRMVEEFALDAAGRARRLRNGDMLNIIAITPEFSNAVVLRGNVAHPIRAAFKPGMRITDLIPSREFLISQASVKKQNDAVAAARETLATHLGGLVDEINWDYAVIERTERDRVTTRLIPFNLGKVFTNPSGPDNALLAAGDTVTVFALKDMVVPVAKRRITVRVEGEVATPGVYQMSPGDDLHTLLALAGGPTRDAYLFGTAFYREQTRAEQQENMDRIISKLEAQLRASQVSTLNNVRPTSTQDYQVAALRSQGAIAAGRESIEAMRRVKPSGRIALNLNPEERSFNKLPALKLSDGDRLLVPARPDFVHVFGAVNIDSSTLWKPGAGARDYIERAGLTPEADVENMFIMRADGSITTPRRSQWLFELSALSGTVIMPGDTIVVPQKTSTDTAWSLFTGGVKEWAQILANFGLGAAAIKVLK